MHVITLRAAYNGTIRYSQTDYEVYCVTECDAKKYGRYLSNFRINWLLPSSGLPKIISQQILQKR
jgi:hypothetical protein